ncbi:hypothetical protein M8J75_001593 [Diaphorina citri]|nr:hypothetical protein M8J75_001593 [Diaphorina citri]
MQNSNDKNGEPSVIWDKLDKEDDAEDIIWDDNTPSPIQEFYKDQTVFITGATGFLGSLLVEKLLRCCPQIRKLILLIRKGKSNSVDERVRDYFNDTVFDRLRLTNPNYHEKVDIVTGHIDAQNFDLTPHEEHLLISQTTIIFHIAATVRFDEHIRTAYNINVRGTETALALAKRMKRLKSFIHVSTAYCNCDRKYIAETFYPPVFTAKELSIILQHSSDEEIALLNEYILGGKPNSYTLTKATAEDLVREVAQELPICVFRPSIVFPTLQEPMPLWNKGSNALITSCYTSGTGLLRVSLMDSNIAIDIVPGDRTINAMTALAWYHSTQQPNKERPTVFNYVSYNDNRLGLGEFLSVALKHAFAAEESCPGILWPASTYFVNRPIHPGEYLPLHKIERQEMGVFLCIASNNVPPTVSKRYKVQVIFKPKVTAAAEYIGVPRGTDVVIQCSVESPRNMNNNWFKYTGEKLINSSKYYIEEIQTSDYTLVMKLIIRNVAREDFTDYICYCENTIGKHEARVKIRETQLDLPKTTTSTTTTSTTTMRTTTLHPHHRHHGKDATGIHTKELNKHLKDKTTNKKVYKPNLIDDHQTNSILPSQISWLDYSTFKTNIYYDVNKDGVGKSNGFVVKTSPSRATGLVPSVVMSSIVILLLGKSTQLIL